MSEAYQTLERDIAYNFRDKELLVEAFLHPSLNSKQNKKNYQRLEFLGDSAISLAVSELLYRNFPSANEGELAKMKAHLVSGEVMAEIAINLNLGNYINISLGEEKTGGRRNVKNLENVLEALIAAIYLDSDFTQAKKIVQKLWMPFVQNISADELDPKTKLQEISQKNCNEIPVYSIVEQKGLKHAPIFTVAVSACGSEASGEGKNLRSAEKEAALILLKKLTKN